MAMQRQDGIEKELSFSDIRPMMLKLFQYHIDKKGISPLLLSRSLKIYIDSFDPSKTYLLKNEADRYLNPSPEVLQEMMLQYSREQYSHYIALNQLVQKSIFRARAIRKELELELDIFGKEFKTHSYKSQHTLIEEDHSAFAETEKDLRERIKLQMLLALYAKKMNLDGNSWDQEKVSKAIKIYERNIEDFERKYLLQDEEGKALSYYEQQSLLTMHILKALAKSLDAHTAFFSSSEAYQMRVQLEKELYGIGVILEETIDGISVAKVVAGGAAEKSGSIKLDDKIIAVNGISIENVPFQKVVEMLRGADGSSLTLEIQRKVTTLGQEHDVTLTVPLQRSKIVLNDQRVTTSYERFEDGIIGKITLNSFYEGKDGISSDRDMIKAILQLRQKGPLKGLILDLRHNTGGFLMQAVKVTGLFITNGVVAISKYSNGEKKYLRDLDGYSYYDQPLIVLTSRISASAAEIVAQALQDYGNAIVVGDDRSYGKGSIQHQTITDEKSAAFFKVTVGRYYTASGRSTQIEGVVSDILVPGIFYKERIGEEFQDYPLASDTISPAFEDKLEDVDMRNKPWFIQYYLPRLQQKKTVWHEMLPLLRKSSQARLKQNTKFTEYFKLYDANAVDYSSEKFAKAADELETEQVKEAVNIIKDMIHFSTNIEIEQASAQVDIDDQDSSQDAAELEPDEIFAH
jgi:carboxyl-terminal processing protease